ncbi:MAG: hypothetical protein H0T90_09530 [Gemmatimonadales bacterium]|nr:hypothetical protein [Gemmatimonadales bacterium]
MADLDLLRRHLLGMGRVLLGYSGGVDSALLAVVGRQALGPDRFLAVIGRSASYPEVQWRSAVELAARFDVPLLEIETRELEDPRYVSNPTNRCYFCKSELWTRLAGVARERQFDVVVDGTNADDLGEHRPESLPPKRWGSARRWRSWDGASPPSAPPRWSWGCLPGMRPPLPVSPAECFTAWR